MQISHARLTTPPYVEDQTTAILRLASYQIDESLIGWLRIMSVESKYDSSLKDISTFIGIVSAIAIALSTSRQLGFFLQIDSKLLALFSVQDILRNSLSYVPFTIFFWGLGIWLAKSLPAPSSSRFTRFFEYKRPITELKISAVAVILYIAFFDFWPTLLLFQSIIIFGAGLTWLRERDKLKTDVSVDVVFALYLVVNAFLLGASEAYTALNANDRNYEITLENGVVKVSILRITSDSLLVVEKEDEIWVIPRSEVIALKRSSLSGTHAIVPVGDLWNWIREVWHQWTR